MAEQERLGGRYTLLNELGTGGMSVVWRAQDEVLGRPVAVKLLAGRYAGDPGSRARIRDEARAAAALSHPNIAQVYDFGESEDNGSCHPYVVMELINGPTLAQRVSHGPLPPRTVFRICAEVAAALAAAHADGLVHRDIKPANVMVTPAGAKVVDFGLAAVAGPIRPDEELFGTPAYLAPERLTGDDVQPASDVYALGVLLYRLLANHSPWSVDTTTQMLDAHIYIEPDPLPQLPGVPAAVAGLVHRCLRKEPAERPTAAEASAVLTKAAGEDAEPVIREPEPAPAVPVPATGRPVPIAGHPPGQGRRRRLLLIGSAVVVVLIAALLAWTLVPRGDDGENPTGLAPAGSSRPSAVADGADAPGAEPEPGPDDGAADDGTVPQSGAAGPQATGGSGGPARPAPGPTATSTPGPAEEPTGTSPPPITEPAAEGRTLSSAAGSVVARCTGGKALLTSWSAKDPYEVERVNAGPVLAATAVFRSDASRIRMTVTCVAGTPTAVVLPL